MEAVQCMAGELEATGRAFDIQFAKGFRYRRTIPKLGYGFYDLAGGRHFRWIELSLGGGETAYGYHLSRWAHTNDPEQDIQETWWARCRVEALLVLY
jgi:hypothetical protein